jgi:hypothetical protein
MPGTLEDWVVGALVVLGVILLLAGLVLIFRPKAIPGDATAAQVPGGINLNLPPPSVLLIIGAALLIAAAYLGLRPTPFAGAGAGSAPAASTAAATPSPGLPAGLPFANLTYPAPGSAVGQAKGLVAGGTVNDPGTYTVWLLDHPSYGYVVDVKATVQGGEWAANDHPLGSPTDPLPFHLTVVAVLADPDCARALNALGASAATNRLQALPDGCSQFGQVTVDVTQR